MLMILKVKNSPWQDDPFFEIVLDTKVAIEIIGTQNGYCHVMIFMVQQGTCRYYMQGDIHSVVETINQAIRKYEDGEICQLISYS